MKCSICPYCWKDIDEEFACCHQEARAPGEIAPCNYDDYDNED